MIKELQEMESRGFKILQKGVMKPKRPEQETPQLEMWRQQLSNQLNPKHPLVVLGARMDWKWFEGQFSEGFGDLGRAALPVRVVVGLLYLKHAENLSDEMLLERWVENPYWQHFCGFEHYQWKAPCDPSSLTRWRQRLGEEGCEKLLKETLRLAMELRCLNVSHLREVIVDTTVQPKNVSYPTDARLLERVLKKVVASAQEQNLPLRQTYKRVSSRYVKKYSRYAHAQQFKRARASIRGLKCRLGRVMRDVRRKSEQMNQPLSPTLVYRLDLARRIHEQVLNPSATSKVYSVHEPDVACIAKGKARQRYEFGSKVSIATSVHRTWVLGVRNFSGNPYDGSTFKEAIAGIERITGASVRRAFVDKGYRGCQHWPAHVEVFVSGRKRLSKRNARLLKRRQAIEPIIGHIKQEHRLGRNFLKGTLGDVLNAWLSAIGFNFRKLMRILRALWSLWWIALFSSLQPLRRSPATP